MSNTITAQDNTLAIVAQLAGFYYADPVAYSSKNIGLLGAKFHQDLKAQVDPKIQKRICTYVAAVFADICKNAGAGDVVVIRGEFTGTNGVTTWHHWNYDRKTGYYIDTMFSAPLVFNKLPDRYKIQATNLTSQTVLWIGLSTLDVCAPL